MSVAVERAGAGPDLVLLHGWGLHGGLFAPLLPALAPRFRVHVVDLPGHGRSGAYGLMPDLRRWVESVRAVVPARAHWLGWSLGGLLAMRAALDAPQAVAKLVLVGANARFASTVDWPHGQAPEHVEALGAELQRDHRATVERFLTLQALGDPRAAAQLRALRARAFEHGEPDRRALADGLRLLLDNDLRDELATLSVPTLVLQGANDRLVPPAAAAAIAEAVVDARLELVPRTAHTPFLADPDAFAGRVAGFLDG